MTLPAQIWIDTQGTLHPVPDGHEQWANAHGFELEELLSQGWVRVQSVIPPYCFLDFDVPLNTAQADAVERLFESRFDQVVIQFRGETRSFTDGEEAMAWVTARQ